MHSYYNEADFENHVLAKLSLLSWHTANANTLNRTNAHSPLLLDTLSSAINVLNPTMPISAKQEALCKITTDLPKNLLEANKLFHKMLTGGIDVSAYTDINGEAHSGGKVYLIDFKHLERNHFIAVNQFTIQEKSTRRPDIILFVNGLPLVVMELKDPTNEKATIEGAFNQISQYKQDIPSLFYYNAFIVISDDINAKAGTITSNLERFMSFKSVNGELIKSSTILGDTLIDGMLPPQRFLEILQDYILFHGNDKILAQYHQFFAIKKALEATNKAKSQQGKIGVIWHTQGSGKSLTMAFYAGQLMRKFDNPTILVVTDRNDLDDQLFTTFSNAQSYIGEKPKQAKDKEEIRNYLNVASGGIVFSTIQKFAPTENKETTVISNRSDIYIIVDEAHRSQYGLAMKMDKEGNTTYGYGKYIRDALPNANFIAFTGTPIDLVDKSTTAVFGDYIDTYDMSRAVDDGATVKIYYDSRFIKLGLAYDEEQLNQEFSEIMDFQDEIIIETKKKEITQMEAIIGSENRLKSLAEDFTKHWQTRKNNAFGKTMIVCMSRKICINLYNEIVKINPSWHSDDKTKGKIKVVITSSITDSDDFKKHATSKEDRSHLAERMKNDKDELEIAIVCDMWLTGFDVPCIHTMYIDKPMVGHNLMQAIARVNRVYKDKSGGLVVDYIGIGNALKTALQQYSASDQHTVGIDLDQAVLVMQEKLLIIQDMLKDLDYSNYSHESSNIKRDAIFDGMNFICELENKETGAKRKFYDNVAALTQAHFLCITRAEAQKCNMEIAYFKAIKASLIKLEIDSSGKKILTEKEINERLAKMLSNTIISDDAINVYSELGIQNPDLSILTDNFLNEISKLKYKNLAIEMLKRLIEDKIRYNARFNITLSEKFSDRLTKAINSYRNKALTNLEIMEELLQMAKDFMHKSDENNSLGLTEDEIAFYDALTKDENVKILMSDEILVSIAKELTQTIRKNMTLDWYNKESVQSEMRMIIKKLLKKYGYPPEQTEGAMETVLKQAKIMSENMF